MVLHLFTQRVVLVVLFMHRRHRNLGVQPVVLGSGRFYRFMSGMYIIGSWGGFSGMINQA